MPYRGAMGTEAPSTDPHPSHVDRAARAEWLARCLVRARDGDRNALDDIVRELNPLLWHVARSLGLGVEEAADVVQTTWLELLRGMHEIRAPQALTAWLVTTARREAWQTRTRLRKRADLDTDMLESTADQRADVVEQVATAERQRVLWRHVQRLSERCRALLRIVAFVDRPDYTAVAEAMQMPRGSIGPTRGRCLAKLREMLLADPAWSGS
jgi:RNA polymerase sigma factor (sigma-70 family)